MNSKKRKRNLGIPDRWLNCPRKGTVIDGVFIPFKTPLSEDYDESVPEANRFSPTQMIDSLKARGQELGMWIDLTNTDRFYDKSEVNSNKIAYVKLNCQGHDSCPSLDQVSSFINIVNGYRQTNNNGLIGVHCTHGFNRTGFMIISYLIEEFLWSAESAIKTFAESRPPGIYKEDYLLELQSRYGDVKITVPDRPSWCFEGSQPAEDTSSSHNNKRRKIDDSEGPVFMKGISGVEPLTNKREVKTIQSKVQQMCNWNRDSFPGSQPVSMDCDNISFLSKTNYQVSWKADGTRYMMLIDGPERVFFIDRNDAVFKVSQLQFKCRKDHSQHITETLVDGEMIIDKVDGQDIPRYLIYDIIKFQGIDVGGTDFCRRGTCIKRELIEPRHELMSQGIIDKTKEPFSVRQKDFWDVSLTHRVLGEKFTSSLPHEIDGLIFQPVPDPYQGGTCKKVLKWKPVELNSIDFKIVFHRIEGEGLLPKTEGLLYVNGYKHPFASIPVTKELRPLNNKIIECKLEDKTWKFMRERTDKSQPNHISTANAIMRSIQTPVTKDFLLNFIHQRRYIP